MKKIVLAVLVSGALLWVAGPTALAAKAAPAGSIELDRGADASESGLVATGSQSADPRYGDSVSFITTVASASRRAVVYVLVVCDQDGEIVYQASGSRHEEFVLADQAGDHLDWDGGAASCESWLIHKEQKGKSYILTNLDMDEFDVAA